MCEKLTQNGSETLSIKFRGNISIHFHDFGPRQWFLRALKAQGTKGKIKDKLKFIKVTDFCA